MIVRERAPFVASMHNDMTGREPIVKLHQVASFFFDDDNSNRNIMRSAQLLACFRQRLSTDTTKNVAEKSNTAAPTRLHQLCIVW